jgi:hypothetical protein
MVLIDWHIACAVYPIPHPASTAQAAQLITLRRRNSQGKRYSLLSIFYRLTALPTARATSFFFCHASGFLLDVCSSAKSYNLQETFCSFTLRAHILRFARVFRFDGLDFLDGVFLCRMIAFQPCYSINSDSINQSSPVLDNIPAEVIVARRTLLMYVFLIEP